MQRTASQFGHLGQVFLFLGMVCFLFSNVSLAHVAQSPHAAQAMVKSPNATRDGSAKSATLCTGHAASLEEQQGNCSAKLLPPSTLSSSLASVMPGDVPIHKMSIMKAQLFGPDTPPPRYL